MSGFVSAKNFLKKIKNTDVVRIGTINLDWQINLNSCKKLVKNFPDYHEHLFDKKKIKESQQISGYNKHNTNIWKTTTQEPALEVPWAESVTNFLPIVDSIVTPTLQKPGNILPWHRDTFLYIRKKYKIPKNKDIVRFLVFMEDWKTGHFIQVKKTILTKWKAGEVILWYPSNYHLSANVGLDDKWTCNITGVLEQKISKKFLKFIDLTN